MSITIENVENTERIENTIENINTEIPIKKKRGRKKKSELLKLAESQTNSSENNITVVLEELNDNTNSTQNAAKKRGRKPKGGKLISKQPDKLDSNIQMANVILHLKCSMKDLVDHNNKINQIMNDPLTYNPSVPPNIMTYNDKSQQFTVYENNSSINNEPQQLLENTTYAYNALDTCVVSSNAICQKCSSNIDIDNHNNINDDDDDINVKDINLKLKKLKLQLYKNSNPEKNSACFWCTYDYDNQPCYIPKHEIDGQLYGYGSFCRPECAVAYLMKENLDDSTKFERYHLLNQIYSKVYNYKKNIKPAPNPYFLLEKFYGNLSIQEYRKLLKTEHMLLVIDKPMTRILPELHEDNEDFIMNIYGGKQQTNQSGVYKVKRQSEKQKGPSKNTIIKENFGF
uniref:MYM-type domain-containing protein n=1 Tax=viral metagenome TaxID=1070528 RepID=A0A6C0DLH8_9ZZZZ